MERSRHGMDLRNWPWSMLVKDRMIERMFVEFGFRDVPPGGGIEVYDTDTMLTYLSSSTSELP